MGKQHNSGDRGRRDTPVLNREDESSPPTEVTIAPGQLVSDRFKILSLLGQGGMGSVYLVHDTLSGKRLAMKTISAETSARSVKRFELEARAISLLDHPNLVQFHDFGLVNGKQPFFLMDYCQGQTLAEFVEAEGPFSEEKALELFITICAALAYAHSQSVVHRDLKPSNIMMTSTAGGGKNVKVLDFGIAKVLLDETAFNTLTRTGEIFGSPYYMSPEQCMGKVIDHRSDIYSLGCVFFETLIGMPPFMSDNPLSTMLKHQAEGAPSLKEASLGREFSADLEKIIARMLAKNADERYENLLLVEHDLRSLKRGEPLESQSTEAQPSKRRLPKVAIAIGAVAMVLVGALCLSLLEKPAKVDPVQTPQSSLPGGLQFLPAWESIGKSVKKSPVSVFFSNTGERSGKLRTFHFPLKSIGKIGHGDDEDKFAPAQGDLVLSIPIGFEVGSDPSVLSGFRSDEVQALLMQGLSVDDSATRLFRNWRNLDTLNLDWCDIGDDSIANMQTLPKLSRLHVANTHISAVGLQQLKLENLSLLEVNNITYAGEILPKLRHSKKLDNLRMAKTGLKDADLKLIGQISPLVVLDIRGNPISDKGIESLASLQNLDYLWFSATNVTPKCIKSIKKMPHLKGITLSMNTWSPQAKASFISAAKKQHCDVEDKTANAKSDL